MKALKLSALAVAAISSAAMAGDGVMPAGVGVEIGTLGYGANVSWAVTEGTEIQAGWNGSRGFKVDNQVDSNKGTLGRINKELATDIGGDFSARLSGKLNTPYVGVQLRPLAKVPALRWVTLGTGVMMPKNSLSAGVTAKNVNETVTINGNKYNINNAATDIALKMKNPLAPYLTVGIRPSIGNNWGISADIGAAYVGNIDTRVSVRTLGKLDAQGQVLPAVTNEAGQDVSDVFKQDMQSKLKRVHSAKIYPIAKVGLNLRF